MKSISKKQWKQVHEFKPNYSSSIGNNAKDMCKDAHMDFLEELKSACPTTSK